MKMMNALTVVSTKTTAHVMKCRDEEAIQRFKGMVEKLNQWMMKINTEPNI